MSAATHGNNFHFYYSSVFFVVQGNFIAPLTLPVHQEKKTRLYDMVRLDLNNDGEITLYDMLLVQKKINKRGK